MGTKGAGQGETTLDGEAACLAFGVHGVRDIEYRILYTILTASHSYRMYTILYSILTASHSSAPALQPPHPRRTLSMVRVPSSFSKRGGLSTNSLFHCLVS